MGSLGIMEIIISMIGILREFKGGICDKTIMNLWRTLRYSSFKRSYTKIMFKSSVIMVFIVQLCSNIHMTCGLSINVLR